VISNLGSGTPMEMTNPQAQFQRPTPISLVEGQGAQVFLEPSAAELLEDKRLDAQVEAGRVTFAIAERAA
jgi:hypothetical protein